MKKEKLEEYCSNDLYDKYLDFELKYLKWDLSEEDDEEKKSIIKEHNIYYDRKKFWRWFDDLPLEDKKELKSHWEMGWEEFVRKGGEETEQDLANIQKENQKEIDEIGYDEWRKRFREKYNLD